MRRLMALAFLTAVAGYGQSTCTALDAFVGSGTDSTAAWLTCINAHPGGTISQAPGIYSMGTFLEIPQSITIQTLGKVSGDPACNYTSDSSCITFQAMPGLNPDPAKGGMIYASGAKSIVFNWVIWDGNKANRGPGTPAYDYCASTDNRKGFNSSISQITSFRFVKSVSKNAVCGTGLELRAATIVVTDSAFVANGVHGGGIHADGLTLLDDSDGTVFGTGTILRNTFLNNTDVDFLFGGCNNCTVQDNTVLHDGAYSTSSFVAFLIHGFPSGGTTGDFTGSDFSNNTVDCGPHLACGGGLVIGPNNWYTANTFGGYVHDNLIKNAQIGFSVVGTTGSVKIANNIVENSGFHTICNSTADFNTQAYEKTGSYTLDTSSDLVPSGYYTGSLPSLTGCIPNGGDSAQTAYTSSFPGTPSASVTTTTATISWSSGSARTTEVLWGLTSAYGNTSGLDYTGRTSHSVTLTGLTPGTVYHASAKQKSTPYMQTDISADFTFTTTALPVSTGTTLSGGAFLSGGATVQ